MIEKKKTGSSSEVRSKLLDFFSKTSIHSLPNIANTERLLVKLVWFTFLMASGGVCAYFVIKNIQEFLKYQVETKVETVVDDEFEFPVITICNMQICGLYDYDFGTFLKRYKQDEQDKYGESRDKMIDNMLKTNVTRNNMFSAKEVFLRKYNDSQLASLLESKDSSVREMMLTCRFNEQPCDLDEFEMIQLGEFHRCYKFNGGKRDNSTKGRSAYKTVNKYGAAYNLHMELYVGSQRECKSPLAKNAGLIVYVHNRTDTLTEEDNAIQVAPGKQVNIALERTFVRRLPRPFGTCIIPSEPLPDEIEKGHIIDTKFWNYGEYTQPYCLMLCYQYFLGNYCRCRDDILPNFKPHGIELCPKFIDSLYNCQYLIQRLFYNGKNDEDCIKKCPNECDYMRYDTTITNIEYPSPGQKKILRNLDERTRHNILNSRVRPQYNRPDEDNNNTINKVQITKETVLAVNIFYTSASYTFIQEIQSISLFDLLPNIGGTMGLFLGISVLTVVEFIELLIEIIWTIRGAKRRNAASSEFNKKVAQQQTLTPVENIGECKVPVDNQGTANK